MYKYLFFVLLHSIPTILLAQREDRSGWINFGSSHASQYLQIAPGKMGPNALLVPPMDYARIKSEHQLETGIHFHQMKGDTAVNSFVSWYWNVAPERVAIEIWGQPSETFRISDQVRDDRQINLSDEGWITHGGDLLISTYVQLIKDKNILPDMSICYTLKTTTGSNRHARYTDASLNYFYWALGKSFFLENTLLDEIRIATITGFYVWQTNKVEMSQDEGAVYEIGLQLRKGWFNLYTEFGGYNGYNAYKFLNRVYGEGSIQGHNDPLILRTRIEKTGKNFNFTAEYQHGFRDYAYQTFRLGVIYHFAAK